MIRNVGSKTSENSKGHGKRSEIEVRLPEQNGSVKNWLDSHHSEGKVEELRRNHWSNQSNIGRARRFWSK